MRFSVLLDTSFFIRLLNPSDKLHSNALNYYKYFLTESITLKVSTISIAEYCVDELSLKTLQILPFNLDHAVRTGEFAAVLFRENSISIERIHPRAIIPNDSKLFAQAYTDKSVTHFVTSNKRSATTFSILKREVKPRFDLLDISTPYNEFFAVLPLE